MGVVGNPTDQVRVRRLEREREDDKQRVEDAKANATQVGFRNWHKGTQEVLESAFKQETIGLVTKEEYVTKRATIEARLEAEALKRKREVEVTADQRRQRLVAEKSKQRKAAKLSFADDDAEGSDASDDILPATTRLRKDDSTRTDFLPDANREKEKEDLAIELKQEWRDKQDELKARELTIPFSYWDGAGHRRKASVTVGDKVSEFLKAAKEQLTKDFRDLRHVSVDNLLFVKDDVLLPQALSFYELIVSEAKGAGPGAGAMFKSPDAEALEGDRKEGRHACKVVERHWYERNKHIFPANRWIQFDADVHMKSAPSGE